MMKKVRVKVFRYNPDVDLKPRYEAYEVPWFPNMKVLDALLYIQENIDPTLAFRYECRVWRCGSCSILINGRPGAACKTEIEEGKDLVLEPLPHLSVIRDLAVDLSGLRQELATTITPFCVVTSKPSELFKIPPEKMEDFVPTTQCIECWSCVSACPVVTKSPADFRGPAFIVALAQSIFNPINEIDHLPTSVSHGLYNCTTCRSCWESCPEELNIPEIAIEKLRALAVEHGIGPLAGHLEFGRLIRETGKSIARTTTSFLESLEKEVIGVKSPKNRVGFFVGCLADYRLQGVARAVVDVLKRQKVEVVIPKNQVCCGSPLIRTGQMAEVKRLIGTNINVFRDSEVDEVVTACAGCSLTLKNNYGSLAEKYLGIKELPFKVYQLSEYLFHNLKMTNEGMNKIEMRVTWHDPCHLRRGQGLYREPRKILRLIPGIELVEMENPDLCCGAGGGVRAGNRGLSRKLGEARVDAIKEVNVDAVVTECPFCVIQILDAVGEAGLNTKVVYLEELLSSAYAPEHLSNK